MSVAAFDSASCFGTLSPYTSGFPLRFYAPSMFGCPPKMMMDSLARLQNVVEAKAKAHSWDYMKDWKKVVEAMAWNDAVVPSARTSALLMHYAAGARAMEAAAPFADLLACFAKRQGMSFVHDKTVYFKSKWLGYSLVWNPARCLHSRGRCEAFCI